MFSGSLPSCTCRYRHKVPSNVDFFLYITIGIAQAHLERAPHCHVVDLGTLFQYDP